MKLLSRFLSVLIFGALFALVAIIGIFYHFGKGLPNYQELSNYEPPIISRIYTNDGRLFGEFAHEQRVFLPIESIPDRVKHAFIAAEDQNFYSHFGVDVIAIVRSAIRNIHRIADKKRPIGGSTITQQVARNFLLTDTARLVSIDRKIKEAILSLRIEMAFTKDHILELYLNDIYLGHHSYGVAAAALNYFDKSLNELTIGEAAFLAGLPKAPSTYNPRTHNQRAVERRNYVIQRMLNDGYITPKEAQKAMQESLQVAKHRRAKPDTVSAPYFSDEVRRIIIEEYGEEALYENGLTIRTTLDARLQRIAHDTLREGLIEYDKRHGWRGPLTRIEFKNDIEKTQEDQKNNENHAKPWLPPLQAVMKPAGIYQWQLAVVLDLTPTHARIGVEDGTYGQIHIDTMRWARRFLSINARGPAIKKPEDVFAKGDVIIVEKIDNATTDSYQLCQIPEVSGALIAMDPFTGRVKAMQGGFNYDLSQYNRATQAMRQPGSAFKPFAYLAALEAGLTPSTIINDTPIAVSLGRGLGFWKPRNHDNKFKGPITLRHSFESSRNAAMVRMVHEMIGLKRVIEITKRLGIYTNLPNNLSVVLGAEVISPLQLAIGYAEIANGGRKIEPIFIDRVQNRKGKQIYASDPRSCRGCEQALWMNQPIPELTDPRPALISPEAAYQITHLLHGVVQNGTSKVVPALKNRPYAGKTGTTNDFKDAWYAGFSPDLVVVVYVGYDAVRSLGPDEFGSKVAAPIFARFMERTLAGTPPKPFRVPPNIKLVRVEHETGQRAQPGDQQIIWEAFRRDTQVPGSSSDRGKDNIAHKTVVGTGQIY